MLPAQVEETVFQAHLLGAIQFLVNRERQDFRLGLDDEFAGDDFNFARDHVGVDGLRITKEHFARNGEHALIAGLAGIFKTGAVGINNDLGQTIVVAQIDENNAAVVALTVDPARQADRLTDVFLAQFAAGVCSEWMHGGNYRVERT